MTTEIELEKAATDYFDSVPPHWRLVTQVSESDPLMYINSEGFKAGAQWLLEQAENHKVRVRQILNGTLLTHIVDTVELETLRQLCGGK